MPDFAESIGHSSHDGPTGVPVCLRVRAAKPPAGVRRRRSGGVQVVRGTPPAPRTARAQGIGFKRALAPTTLPALGRVAVNPARRETRARVPKPPRLLFVIVLTTDRNLRFDLRNLGPALFHIWHSFQTKSFQDPTIQLDHVSRSSAVHVNDPNRVHEDSRFQRSRVRRGRAISLSRRRRLRRLHGLC